MQSTFDASLIFLFTNRLDGAREREERAYEEDLEKTIDAMYYFLHSWNTNSVLLQERPSREGSCAHREFLENVQLTSTS